MSPTPRALTRESLGAWLVKVSSATGSLEALVASGFSGSFTWCVRPTYRADLVEPGQPVVLWVSGRGPRAPAGLHAHGRTTGRVVVMASDPSYLTREEHAALAAGWPHLAGHR